MANVRSSSRRTNGEVDSDATIGTQSRTSTDVYTPELDSQMEKVQIVSPRVQCESTPSYRAANSAAGNVNEAHKVEERLVEDKPPPPCPKVNDYSQAAPVVPQRRKDADRASIGYRTNTLTNQYLGLLPRGVSQQAAMQCVINGDHHDYINQDHHDYINQDHLDSILEEQEMAFEPERAGINNGDEDHPENGSNYRLDESLADATARKGKVIVHDIFHLPQLLNEIQKYFVYSLMENNVDRLSRYSKSLPS